MSTSKVKPQLPPTEKVRKRGDFMEASGYRSGVANGIVNIYQNIGSAPDATNLQDGLFILVVSGSDLNAYASYSGSWTQVKL